MVTGYLSLRLTAESTQALATQFASHPKVFCHHMTLIYGTHELSALPTAFADAKPGDTFTLRVLGFARSSVIEAVAVGLVRPDGSVVVDGISDNRVPHITVALVPELAKPSQSNALLEQGFEQITGGLELTAELVVVKFEQK